MKRLELKTMVRIGNLEATTERLVIRPYKTVDYSNWYHQYAHCYAALNKFDEGKIDLSDYTEVWFDEMVKKHLHFMNKDEAYILGVFKIEDGAHVGVIDVSTLMRNEFQWGRIGYTILNTYWQQGYGKEAVKAVLDMAFTQLGYHRIEAHINMDNTASIKLAESAGMEFECVRRAFIFEFGEWTDHLVYFRNAKQE
ncbi:GNAT family N-acetyltransferase [Fictibacillus terranigra]|uniref:GNAT family N-acetyltransferase n=1 Tax=Fictibacillus terranigra TaxID=3058424 RepID=A0ABT8E803_9BACL|nr:GNAT family N-acetyltransferase [Fictibacillus sp. CENA-BCM004]MDN4074015.1 GNAT family N-acetyltransferase [Fictibacillus sp. CENA-BCM004]